MLDNLVPHSAETGFGTEKDCQPLSSEELSTVSRECLHYCTWTRHVKRSRVEHCNCVPPLGDGVPLQWDSHTHNSYERFVYTTRNIYCFLPVLTSQSPGFQNFLNNTVYSGAMCYVSILVSILVLSPLRRRVSQSGYIHAVRSHTCHSDNNILCIQGTSNSVIWITTISSESRISSITWLTSITSLTH